MRLIGRNKLNHSSHDAMAWMKVWAADVIQAQWKEPEDVIRQFPKAKISVPGNFLFNVGEYQLQLQITIAFPQGIALVTDLKEISGNGN